MARNSVVSTAAQRGERLAAVEPVERVVGAMPLVSPSGGSSRMAGWCCCMKRMRALSMTFASLVAI